MAREVVVICPFCMEPIHTARTVTHLFHPAGWGEFQMMMDLHLQGHVEEMVETAHEDGV